MPGTLNGGLPEEHQQHGEYSDDKGPRKDLEYFHERVEAKINAWLRHIRDDHIRRYTSTSAGDLDLRRDIIDQLALHYRAFCLVDLPANGNEIAIDDGMLFQVDLSTDDNNITIHIAVSRCGSAEDDEITV